MKIWTRRHWITSMYVVQNAFCGEDSSNDYSRDDDNNDNDNNVAIHISIFTIGCHYCSILRQC